MIQIKYVIVVFVSTILLSACKGFAQLKESPDETRSLMIGEWCGNRVGSEGELINWAIDRSVDGAYKIRFKKRHGDGRSSEWEEHGIWGVRFPIYFTIVMYVIDDGVRIDLDTTKAKYYDAYNILKLDKKSFTYTSYASGKTYEVSKICEYS